MPKTFEKDFISCCNNQELEVNPNQIAVIKKLEQYYHSNFKSFFSKLFSKQNFKNANHLVFTYFEKMSSSVFVKKNMTFANRLQKE